ncbi:alcohol dehydrogenase AdhP, partial [Streptococcus suis]
MKAVVVNPDSTGVEIVDHEMPEIGYGEALVKVEY